jgi:plasmid stabilization system protein ParE
VTLPILITPEAEEDLAEAKKWYEGKQSDLGEEFLEAIEVVFDHIRRIPEAATEVAPGVRRVVVRRFPYGVFYRVDTDQIAILAVYHSKRDPKGWQDRVS